MPGLAAVLPPPPGEAQGKARAVFGRILAPVRRLAVLLAASLPALLGTAPALSAPRKKPAPTATPTPAPLLRAAGACLSYVPGKYIVLAEVGTTGRVFGIDSQTRLDTKVRAGARIRILYMEGPEGPVARRILPGPAPQKPAPTPTPA